MKFCAGDFLLDDAPLSGRPVEVDRDQIEIFLRTIHVTLQGRIRVADGMRLLIN